MLNIYRIDHIGQVVPDLDKQATLMEGLFGFCRVRAWENSAEGSKGVLFDVPGSWGQRWEVLAPLGAHSPWQAVLDLNGAGVHHLAMQVNDLTAAKRELQTLGLAFEEKNGCLHTAFAPPQGPKGIALRLFAPPVLATCGDDGRARAISVPAVAGPNLGIVGVEQVGQAYPDRDALAHWCEQALGMRELYHTKANEHPDMATGVLTIPGTQMRWELIAPVGADSFVQKFIDKRGAGVAHVTFEVRDYDAAMAAAEHHDVPTINLHEGETDGAKWKDWFIHPRHTGGFLMQLFWEERPGVWSRSDKIAAHA